MKINFNTELKTISGKEIKGEDNKILTLGDVCTNALLTNFKDENIEGKEKLRRFKLAQKIYGVKELVSIEAEDIVSIKDLVAKAYTTIVVGQAWELLEGEKSEHFCHDTS